MAVTLKDVARMANVSTATVSRFLNNKHKGNMSQETYNRIEKVLEETNYVPHAIASGLRTGLTKVIGVVVPDNVNPYYAQLGHAIENACFNAGYTALICNTDQNVEKERKYLRLLISQRVAGIVLCSTGLKSEEIEDSAARDFTRVVLVDEPVDGFEGPLVIADDFRGGYVGMEYLYSLGHERILVITGPMSLGSTLDRLRGVRQCAADMQKPLSEDNILHAQYTLQTGHDMVKSALLKAAPRFSAIFTFNDLMAIGAMKALDEWGFKVPDDYSVLGYDNIFLDDLIKPTLTSVASPIESLGIQSFKLITGPRQNPLPKKRILFEPQLVLRGSCRKYPGAHR